MDYVIWNLLPYSCLNWWKAAQEQHMFQYNVVVLLVTLYWMILQFIMSYVMCFAIWLRIQRFVMLDFVFIFVHVFHKSMLTCSSLQNLSLSSHHELKEIECLQRTLCSALDTIFSLLGDLSEVSWYSFMFLIMLSASKNLVDSYYVFLSLKPFA